MNVEYMTLEGEKDKDKFIEEWKNSDDLLASFLQAGDTVYIMPYGTYDCINEGDKNKKFSGSFRRHTFIKRDFEIEKEILGGGSLKLDSTTNNCQYWDRSTDFGEVPNIEAVVNAVTKLLSS